MIRYVLAVILAATILGLTATAIDHVSADRGEQAIEAEINTVDEAATELIEAEAATPTDASPQRVIEVDIPGDSRTKAGTERLVFEPVSSAEATRVTYRVSGQPEQTMVLDVSISPADGNTVDLSNRRGTQRLLLTLETDGGDPVVEVSDLQKEHI